MDSKMSLSVASGSALYDHEDVRTLLKDAFGTNRHERGVYALRSRSPLFSYALHACDAGDQKYLVSTVSFWPVVLPSGHDALLLGPMAVHHKYRNQGLGAFLICHALASKDLQTWPGVCVSGERTYYQRFGFVPLPTSWRVPGGATPPLILMIKWLNGQEISLEAYEGVIRRQS